MTAIINSDVIFDWSRDYSRKIKPVSDIGLMLKNSRAEFLATLRAYIDYAIRETGNHEDYQIHSCGCLLDETGPFHHLLGDVYRSEIGGDDFENEQLSVDDLSSFIQTQNDNLIESYTWHYLIALRGVEPRDEPFDLHENFDDIISEQFVVVINNLREL
jgi:hypothetical protein